MDTSSKDPVPGGDTRLVPAAVWLLRSISVLLVLFALGHTAGILSFVAPTADARAVKAAMDTVKFGSEGDTFSYGQFYLGFGWFVTFGMLFTAAITWWLSQEARRGGKVPLFPASAVFVLQLAGLVLALLYFPLPPIIFSVLTTACAGAIVAVGWRLR
jgi:hypothetical protein